MDDLDLDRLQVFRSQCMSTGVFRWDRPVSMWLKRVICLSKRFNLGVETPSSIQILS